MIIALVISAIVILFVATISITTFLVKCFTIFGMIEEIHKEIMKDKEDGR